MFYQQLRIRRAGSCPITAACCAALLAASGCQTVNTELAQLFGDVPPVPAPTAVVAESPNAESPNAEETPKFQVELRAEGRKPELVSLPLSGPIFVQQALDQAGASRRFRRMKIEVYRRLPEGGGHRFDVTFDRATHRVPPGTDYAIHPNDRIVATEDTSTIVDDMMSSLGSKLGGS